MHYVYVLKSLKDGTLYIGQTNDFRRRFMEHQNGKVISTKHNALFQIVYYEAYRSMADAKFRETQLKRHAAATAHLKRRLKNSLDM